MPCNDPTENGLPMISKGILLFLWPERMKLTKRYPPPYKNTTPVWAMQYLSMQRLDGKRRREEE